MAPDTQTRTAFIASLPDRKEMLITTIKSLIDQLDKIYILLNGYEHFEANEIRDINRNKIIAHCGDNSLGDAGKFSFISQSDKGYRFTVDDDMIFPPDYINVSQKAIEKYKRLAVVSYHGRNMEFPVVSYYHGSKDYFPFHKDLKHDTPCHIIGTGCMAWHSDTIDISMSDFPSKNMADIHFSILAQKKEIPLIVLAHNQQWIKYTHPKQTIYSMMEKNDSEQVRRINGFNSWKLHHISNN